MFCTLEQAKGFKKTSKELIELVKENLSSEREPIEIEDFEVVFDGRNYSFCEVDEDDIISDGKYESGGNTYQLVEFDKTIEDYPCTKSITGEYDLLAYVGFSRTGSYYSDWYYEYDKPELQQIGIKLIPEQVIPEHDEIVIEYL